jgi:hypothetical protein
MTSSYKTDWPLPDAYLIELGRVTALWASLETFLNVCIGQLAGFNSTKDTTPFILVNHASFPQRLDMLGALCEELKEEYPHLAHHKEVLLKLKSAQSARNRYSHNGISFDPDKKGYFLAQGSARGKVKTTVTPVSSGEIHEASKEVHLALLALYKLVLQRDVPPIWVTRAAP